MKRLFAAFIGLCLIATVANAFWQSRAQNSIASASSPPAIDGVSNTIIGGGLTHVVTLSTTKTNDVIIVITSPNGQTVSTILDTAGLTYTKRTSSPPFNSIEEWSAQSPGILTSDVITVTFAGSTGFGTTNAFGISGANVASPFDSGGPQHGTTAPLAMTTANNNAFAFGACRFGSTSAPTAGAGWTGIVTAATGAFFMSEWQVFATAGAVSLTTSNDADANGCVVDAVKP